MDGSSVKGNEKKQTFRTFVSVMLSPLLETLEKITTIVSIFTTILGIFQVIYMWPVTIFVTGINLFLYYHQAIYFSCLFNGFSILNSLYGWYRWGGGKRKKKMPTTRISLSDLPFPTAVLFLCSLLFLPLYYYFGLKVKNIGADSLRVALMGMGMWLTANKKIEAYVVWTAVNLVSIYLFYQKNMFWFCAKHGFYLLFSIVGFKIWYQRYKKDQLFVA